MLTMLLAFLAWLVCVAVAGLVVVYFAFPHRGQAVPKAPWLGDKLIQLRDSMPSTLTEEDSDRASSTFRR